MRKMGGRSTCLPSSERQGPWLAMLLPAHWSGRQPVQRQSEHRKRSASGIDRPNSASIRANIRVAINECPPSSKKLSWIPTRFRPNASAQIRASLSSTSVLGAA